MTPARVVCFGEVLVRLSAPRGEALLQGPALEARIGGAEANVAVSLAHLGQDSAVVSVLPDDPLGQAALGELRRHGVDISGVRTGQGRMGLYFVTPGAVQRPFEVHYDRSGSAFALADPGLVDWPAALQRAAWLHLSGVTPAIGASAAAAAERAVAEAGRLGVGVSFDGNYRLKLWQAWGGDAPGILRRLVEGAALAFADERDLGLILGAGFEGDDPLVRRRLAAEAAFGACPKLERIASTVRVQHGADDHDLSAVLLTREGEHQCGPIRLGGIVDRIGSGDAFAAGLLHALIQGRPDGEALEFALAAAVLKHSYAGDFNLASEAEIEALAAGAGLDVRR